MESKDPTQFLSAPLGAGVHIAAGIVARLIFVRPLGGGGPHKRWWGKSCEIVRVGNAPKAASHMRFRTYVGVMFYVKYLKKWQEVATWKSKHY